MTVEEIKKEFPPGTVYIPTHMENNIRYACFITSDNYNLIKEDDRLIAVGYGNSRLNGHEMSEFLFDNGRKAKIIFRPGDRVRPIAGLFGEFSIDESMFKGGKINGFNPEELELFKESNFDKAKRLYKPGTVYRLAHRNESIGFINIINYNKDWVKSEHNNIKIPPNNSRLNNHNYTEMLYYDDKWAEIVFYPKQLLNIKGTSYVFTLDEKYFGDGKINGLPIESFIPALGKEGKIDLDEWDWSGYMENGIAKVVLPKFPKNHKFSVSKEKNYLKYDLEVDSFANLLISDQINYNIWNQRLIDPPKPIEIKVPGLEEARMGLHNLPYVPEGESTYKCMYNQVSSQIPKSLRLWQQPPKDYKIPKYNLGPFAVWNYCRKNQLDFQEPVILKKPNKSRKILN